MCLEIQGKTKKEIGDQAELYTIRRLEDIGYKLLERNFRYKKCEVDLIFQFGATLIIVEVKFRSNEGFGYPEDFVDAQQFKRIQLATDQYIHEHNWDGELRFDIVAITQNNYSFNFQHFQDIS